TSSQILYGGVQVDPDKAIYARDLWLSYYSVADVQGWAAWFERNLPKIIDLFEHERYSEQYRARSRFDEMMGRVQKSQEFAAKIAILTEYAETEADAHYRATGCYWLDEALRKQGKSWALR